MIYKTGTKITCKDDGQVFIVTESTAEVTKYRGPGTSGECPTPLLADQFIVEGEPLPTVAEAMSALDVQEGGEQDKGGILDIRKAGHTLQGLVELLEVE